MEVVFVKGKETELATNINQALKGTQQKLVNIVPLPTGALLVLDTDETNNFDYQVKRLVDKSKGQQKKSTANEPATYKQKNYIKSLYKQNNLPMDVDFSTLTKKQAGRLIHDLKNGTPKKEDDGRDEIPDNFDMDSLNNMDFN